MVTRSWLALAAAVEIAAAALAAPQPVDSLARYRAAVDAYRAGRAFDDAGLGAVSADAAVDRVIDTAAGWSEDDLTAAVMLHTDAALSLAKRQQPSDASAHIDRALRLLRAAVERDAERIDYALRWRDAVAGLLHAYGAPQLESDLRERASVAWPRTRADVARQDAFKRGFTLEIQAGAAGRLSGPLPKQAVIVPPEALSLLRDAEGAYDEALAGNRRYYEALLHLGRVQLLRGHLADAETTLRSAAEAESAFVRYLALMFHGAASERQGRLEDAASDYRAAADRFRWGQSAPLALSHVLMRAGRDTEGRAVLASYFTPPHGRAIEPLWTYLADPATELGPTLDELRAEVWK